MLKWCWRWLSPQGKWCLRDNRSLAGSSRGNTNETLIRNRQATNDMTNNNGHGGMVVCASAAITLLGGRQMEIYSSPRLAIRRTFRAARDDEIKAK